jgi:hypothetical protein
MAYLRCPSVYVLHLDIPDPLTQSLEWWYSPCSIFCLDSVVVYSFLALDYWVSVHAR